MSNPWPFDGGIIGTKFASTVPAPAPLIDPVSTTPKLYPLPPADTTVFVIWPLVSTSTTT